MFLNTQLYDKLWTSLRSTTSPTLQTAVESLRPQELPPFENLHTHTYQSLPVLNGKLVCLRMMIQDIFETEYYSAAVVKSRNSQTREELEKNVIINKYWVNITNLEDIEQNSEHVILDREVYRATIPKGQADWVTKANGSGNIDSVILKCFHHEGFKLGQIVNVVGVLQFTKSEKLELIQNGEGIKDISFYYPPHEVPRVNVVAVLNEKQIEEHRLDFKLPLLKRQINLVETRQKLIQLFTRFCSPKYAKFLLYSLVNNAQRMSMYISGENLYPLLKHLLPFIVKVDVKIPFKQHLFPQKVDVIKDSILQLSEEETYVVIDFTHIGQGKLQGEEVLNLQLLKKFAEDGELLYRWEIGETMFTRNSTGLIAKAPSIIEPTFNLKNEFINLDKLPEYEEIYDYVDDFRAYILQIRHLSENVFLSSDSEKQLIEADFVDERQETEGKLSPQTFSQRLLIARLEAASVGENELTYKVYQRIKELTK